MKKTIHLSEKLLIVDALQQAGMLVSLINRETHQVAVKCLYTCNSDGSVRWVWPLQNNHADMLKFYHAKGGKAFLISLVMKIVFALRIQRFVFKAFNIYSSHNEPARWALFTGTVGPNRKMVLWNMHTNGEAFFSKIAMTNKAILNIQHEAKSLMVATSQQTMKIIVPASRLINNNVLQLQDISTDAVRTNQLHELPVTAMQEWCRPSAKQPIQQTAAWKSINQSLSNLALLNDQRIAIGIIDKLATLVSKIDTASIVPLAKNHGDFTPWNIWMKDNRLCMIDWELFEKEVPALADVFHFVYQRNILIGNKGYASIRKELDTFFNQETWQVFIQQYQLDVYLLEQLYLLKNICYNLELYSNQENWHQQVQWLLQTWNDAVTHFINAPNQRKALLQDISIMLHNKAYAAMKLTEGSFEKVFEFSDIDICILPKDAQSLVASIDGHPFVLKVSTKKFSYMHQVCIQMKNGALLHIDCIFKFKRKSVVFLDEREVLKNSKRNAAGVMTASIEHDFTYTWLFYWLNHSAIPDRYCNFFKEQSSEKQRQINNSLQQKWNIADYHCLLEKPTSINNSINHRIMNMQVNKGFQAIFNKFVYALDYAKKLFPTKGFIITFSGVDGAGKSTVIENVKHLLEKKYRKQVVVLRHRPSLLPILSAWKHGKEAAEKKAANTLPRQGNNSNSFSSTARFAYYYCDYFFGQLYVYMRFVMMGYVVLYDRYYFDFINDSKRSNINLPKPFTSWFYKFLLKPRFNFFLYAKAEEILARKKELDEPTINLLTEQYMSLFKQLNSKYRSSAYLPLYNNNLSVTLATIESTIK